MVMKESAETVWLILVVCEQQWRSVAKKSCLSAKSFLLTDIKNEYSGCPIALIIG